MKALLLAAGYGTRLRPLTDHTPKCLVPIHGEPLLGIWLDRLTAAGVGPFLVNTHYLSDQVRSYLVGGRHAAQVTVIEEKQLLGTAGTLIANADFFEGQDGMMIHADNYCLADFSAFLQAHRQRPTHCEMTMMTFKTATPQSCGIVELDDQGVVIGFHEKVAHPPSNLANGAIYLLSAKLLQRLGRECTPIHDFSVQVLPSLIGRIYTYETSAFFLDIGTPEAYRLANEVAASRSGVSTNLF